MLPLSCSSDIVIPKSWPKNIKSTVLHVISLAHYAITYARGWAANSINARVRLQAKLNAALEEIAKLREELRIKDTDGQDRSSEAATLSCCRAYVAGAS